MTEAIKRRSLYRKADPALHGATVLRDKPEGWLPGTYEVTVGIGAQESKTTLVVPENRVRPVKPPKGAKKKAKR